MPSVELVCRLCGKRAVFNETVVQGRPILDWWEVVCDKRCKACRVTVEIDNFVLSHYVIAGTGREKFADKEVYSLLVDYVRSVAAVQPVVLVSGALQGWDSAIVRVGYDLSLPVVLCVPNKGFGAYYWKNRFDEFQFMVSCARFVEYTLEDWIRSTADKSYRVTAFGSTAHVNVWRNRRMIQLAAKGIRFGIGGEFVAYWKPDSRGTTSCLLDLQQYSVPMADGSNQLIPVQHFGDEFGK